MIFFSRRMSNARRRGACGLTVPAVGLGVWAGVVISRGGAVPLAATPLALAVAFSAGYGGFGPGLFALVQAVLAIDFFLIEPGALFRFTSGAQAAALPGFTLGWTIFCLPPRLVVRPPHRARPPSATAPTS